MTTTKRDLARTVAQEVWCTFPEALALVEAVFDGLREWNVRESSPRILAVYFEKRSKRLS